MTIPPENEAEKRAPEVPNSDAEGIPYPRQQAGNVGVSGVPGPGVTVPVTSENATMPPKGETEKPRPVPWPPVTLPKGPGGAPEGNVNRVVHGGRSARHGVVLARLGKRFRGAYVDACHLRTHIETLVRQRHGELTLSQVAKIQTLARLEQSSRALELGMRDGGDKMTVDDLIRARTMIGQWSRERDNLLAELLGTSTPGGGHFDASQFYAPTGPQEPTPGPSGSTAAEPDTEPEQPRPDTTGAQQEGDDG